MKTKEATFKLLTFAMLMLVGQAAAFASLLSQVDTKTHLRWHIFTDKSDLVIEKRPGSIILKSLNRNFFKELEKSLADMRVRTNYVKEVRASRRNRLTNAFEVEIILANKDVDVFNFYKSRDKNHIIDFWTKEAPEKISDIKVDIKEAKPVTAPKKITVLETPKKAKVVKAKKKITRKKIMKKKDSGYRDFRYGASFVWDYDSLTPSYRPLINIDRKTPEYFYPIKNVDYKKGKREAHLQLAINYYRKKNYGLMNRTIKLYYDKYGEDKNMDSIEYMKANAILRDHIEGKSTKTYRMAVNMLETIARKTQNYDLKKAIYKYLLSYSLKSKEYVKGLNIAKSFYVQSKNNFDYEESQSAIEAILYNLSRLNQVGKLRELIKDKTIVKIMPKQKMLAYEIYVFHRLGNMKEVLKVFNAKKKDFSRPYTESIQFNVAEAYFRIADYDNAVKMFDEFITHYNYDTRSGYARMRIALAYDIQDKDLEKVKLLYLAAINKSQANEIVAEARVRYAALETVRKRDLTKDDLEKRVFLDLDENIELSKNIKKLLWQVRLRSFIVDKKYRNALAYLTALPILSLTPVERRVFEADAAEIIYGKIYNAYLDSDYTLVLKTWSTFKKKYVKKVAKDPYMNFIVGRSYLKLGLYDGFENILTAMKKGMAEVPHTFPHWIIRPKVGNRSLGGELKIIKDLKVGDLDSAKRNIDKLKKTNSGNTMLFLYDGHVSYLANDFSGAEKNFEKYFSSQGKSTYIDPVDLSNIMMMYSESIYNQKKYKKFLKVAKALLADTKGHIEKNEIIKSSHERINYLVLEIDAGNASDKVKLSLEYRLKEFQKDYPKSIYKGRIDYLLGRTLLENKKREEAKKIFNQILGEEGIDNSLKELARSELSLMAIKEQTL